MDQLIVATCRSMHSDLVFNRMVRLASADGSIDPRERRLLHDVLAASFGVLEAELADARIAVEMQRDLPIDPVVLRKHLPEEAMVSLYRFLYAMAGRDGHLDGREHNFLIDVLEKFGLDAATVQQVEREVVEGVARHADWRRMRADATAYRARALRYRADIPVGDALELAIVADQDAAALHRQNGEGPGLARVLKNLAEAVSV